MGGQSFDSLVFRGPIDLSYICGMERLTYPSKLLLFGEYTIIKGSKALAMPLPLFGGQWVQNPAIPEEEMAKASLRQLLTYLQQLQLSGQLSFDLALSDFAQLLSEGWYFESSIPIGYGLGSSGALTAAVYDRFYRGAEETNWQQLKGQLAQIEAYFHGESSGIDPLICLLNQAILLESKTSLKPISIPDWKETGPCLFLLNTQMPRQTAPLVQIFQKRCEDEYYNLRCQAELAPQTDDAIHAFLHQQSSLLFDCIHEIGHFQYRYFDAMIPQAFRPIWLDGLSGNLYKLKLCGAGGGGFILGFTQNWEQTQVNLKDYELIKVLG